MTTQPEAPDRSSGSRPNPLDPITRVVEAAVYAPIGIAAFVREMGPDFVRTVVARGRAEVDVAHEQVVARVRHAKGAGEVAIAFGLPVVRRKVGERFASFRPAPPRAPTPAPRRPPAAAKPPSAAAATAGAPANSNGHAARSGTDDGRGGDAAPAEQLAIPGYDALSASQVVERLAGLSGDELAAVREYEAGHRRRRTILGKIEQLSI
jgi:hypothetical protein